jgi:uncharacterized protein
MAVEDLLSRVSRALLPLSQVRAALVYGSRVAGTARPDSDIDVAVLLDVLPQPDERRRLLWTLLGALGSELGGERVDLVLLNEAPPKLALRVLKQGQVALLRDPVDLHRFRVRTYSLHADYQPVERLFREATKRRARATRPLG